MSLVQGIKAFYLAIQFNELSQQPNSVKASELCLLVIVGCKLNSLVP